MQKFGRSRVMGFENLERREVLSAASAAIETISKAETTAFQQIAIAETQLSQAMANQVQYGTTNLANYEKEYSAALSTAGKEENYIAIATATNYAQAYTNPAAAIAAENAAINTALGVVTTQFNQLEAQLRLVAEKALAGTWTGYYTYHTPFGGSTTKYQLDMTISVSSTGALTATGSGLGTVLSQTTGPVLGENVKFTFNASTLTFNNSTQTLSGDLVGTTAGNANPQLNGIKVDVPVSWIFYPTGGPSVKGSLGDASSPIAPSQLNKE